MKVKMFILAMSLMISGSAMAQNGQGMNNEERIKMMTERITEQLKLDEKQSKEVQKIYTEQSVAMREAGGRDATPEARTKIMSDTEAKMKKVLTEQQFKKWKENMAAQGNRPGGGGGQR